MTLTEVSVNHNMNYCYMVPLAKHVHEIATCEYLLAPSRKMHDASTSAVCLSSSSSDSSDSEGDATTAKSSVVSLLDVLKALKLSKLNRKRKVYT